MRSLQFASLSIFFGFYILGSSAEYKCSSRARFSDEEVETRANAIYSRGEELKDYLTDGQNKMEDIGFFGSEAYHDLRFEAAFIPASGAKCHYQIRVSYPSREIYLIEYNGYMAQPCRKS
ncbi:BgTH12-06226 [Blumeria graminis f. sp. triticale]|uniref:BgtE-20107 n=3 Tax=Blumeria graminis TaxID=34373 RepID=A0A9X9LBA7_BLUGR|nr:BgTH12-06226 [Blumeria graminis f. sp. triticale]VCU40778.1 BgtE-20107 [Blumeria graminis f. sp. tritici]